MSLNESILGIEWNFPRIYATFSGIVMKIENFLFCLGLLVKNWEKEILCGEKCDVEIFEVLPTWFAGAGGFSRFRLSGKFSFQDSI